MKRQQILRCLAYLCFMLGGIGISFYYAYCESGAYFTDDVWSQVWVGSAVFAAIAFVFAWCMNHYRFRSRPTAEIWIVLCLMLLVTGRYFFAVSEGRTERVAFRKKLDDHHRLEVSAMQGDFDPTDTRMLQIATPEIAREKLSIWVNSNTGSMPTSADLDQIMGVARFELKEVQLDEIHSVIRRKYRLEIKKIPSQ